MATMGARDMIPHGGVPTPRPALIMSTVLSMCTITVLGICLMRRVQGISDWLKIPLTRWLIVAIYSDSIIFIFTTAILEHGFGLNSSMAICDTAILICLTFYMTTKLIYYFLVEKVYIVRSVSTPRLKSKLYVFNCFGMLLPYAIIVVLNFVYRTAYFNAEGICVIGMQFHVMLPLILFDSAVNLYLTLLFVIPLRSLYTYRHKTASKAKSTLHTIAFRSFVGSLGTLASSIINLTILMVLKGEAAWICLMCCNADILFSVIVLHWVTGRDSSSDDTKRSAAGASRRMEGSRAAYGNNGMGSGVGKLDRFEAYGKAGVMVSMRRSLDEQQPQMPQPGGIGVVTTHISAQEMPVARLKHYPSGSNNKLGNSNTRSTSQDTDTPILYEQDEEMMDMGPSSTGSSSTTHTAKGSLGGITVSVGHVVSVEEDGVEVVGLPDLGLGLTRSLEEEVGGNGRGRARGREGCGDDGYRAR